MVPTDIIKPGRTRNPAKLKGKVSLDSITYILSYANIIFGAKLLQFKVYKNDEMILLLGLARNYN